KGLNDPVRRGPKPSPPLPPNIPVGKLEPSSRRDQARGNDPRRSGPAPIPPPPLPPPPPPPPPRPAPAPPAPAPPPAARPRPGQAAAHRRRADLDPRAGGRRPPRPVGVEPPGRDHA